MNPSKLRANPAARRVERAGEPPPQRRQHNRGSGGKLTFPRIVARYLVVAHQTADSPTLLVKLLELAGADPDAEFQILAPVRPVGLMLLAAGEQRTPLQIAWQRARRTQERLAEAGLNVIGARPGLKDPWLDPVDRIEHELRYHGPYHAVVISTLPHPFSSWLRRDVPHRLARRHPELRVEHVLAPDWFHLEPEPATVLRLEDHRPAKPAR